MKPNKSKKALWDAIYLRFALRKYRKSFLPSGVFSVANGVFD